MCAPRLLSPSFLSRANRRSTTGATQSGAEGDPASRIPPRPKDASDLADCEFRLRHMLEDVQAHNDIG